MRVWIAVLMLAFSGFVEALSFFGTKDNFDAKINDARQGRKMVLSMDFFIELDGLFYEINTPSGGNVALLSPGFIIVDNALVSNCQRSNGEPPVSSGFVFMADNGAQTVFLGENAAWTWLRGMGLIRLNSTTNDLVCDNPIDDPFFLPELIYRDGFETRL